MNSSWNFKLFIQENATENVVCKMPIICLGFIVLIHTYIYIHIYIYIYIYICIRQISTLSMYPYFSACLHGILGISICTLFQFSCYRSIFDLQSSILPWWAKALAVMSKPTSYSPWMSVLWYYQHELTLIPVGISNHLPGTVWDEITYLFSNFYGCTVEDYEWIRDLHLEVWESIINFIPHFTR